MKKLRLNKVIYQFLLLLFLAERLCMQVQAAELELEPAAYKNDNPFKFELSDIWTSEGETIRSYDVSENGQIAIAFSDDTIGVFDHDMNFLYQLLFKTNGASGVLWLDERLLFIDVRTETAIVCDDDGQPDYFYKITGPINYGYNIMEKRSRKQGDDEYYCIKNGGNNDPLIHYGYYTMLKRTLGDGREEILYTADEPADRSLLGKWGFILAAALCGIVPIHRIYRKR